MKAESKDLLQPIIDFYNKTGKVPGRRDVPANKILWKYKSWSKAIEAAGFKPRRVVTFTEQQLIESLQRFYRENLKSPRAEDCNKTEYLFDTKTYINSFKVKSWGAVLEKAGLEKYIEFSPYTKLSDADLLNKLKEFFDTSESTSISFYSQNRKDLPSYSYLCERFGSWQIILKKINAEVNINKYSNEYLIKMIREAVDFFGKTPSTTQLYQFTGIVARAWTKRFGKWNEFLKSINIDLANTSPVAVSEDDEQLKKLYIDFSINNGYKNGATTRVLNNSPEIYNAAVFEIRFGSINMLREVCGFQKLKRGKSLYSENEILKMLEELHKKYGRVPTSREIKNSDLPCITTILRYTKSTGIKEAIKKAINIK